MNRVEANTQASPKPGLSSEWKWIVLVCVILGLSGGIRYWRDWQFGSLKKESEAPPFALAEIPTVLGSWHAIEGSEDKLEPEIAKISGAKDHLIRTYEDDKSGQRASVMVLYGLAYIVWAHSPDVCYPATGFRTLLPSQDQDLEIPVPEKPTTARFRLEHYVKSTAGQTDYRQVYYSFQNAGRWGVDKGRNWKSFRYHPGMFRVQVQCQGSNRGKTDENSVKELIGRIVQEIERRSAGGG